MIYPLVNFFFEPSLGFLGTAGGSGKKEELGESVGADIKHWLSGGPHSILFPSKEEVGNVWRVDGIEPFKWLWLKFNCLRPGILNSGIDPVRKLFWSFKLVRCVKFFIVAGMLPVKELNERSTKLSWREREDGIAPEKLLCCRYTKWREGRESKSDGRSPLRKLDRRLMMTRASSFPIVLAGIGPYSPTPGRWTATTRE